MSYCSRSRRRRFTILDLRRNGYLCTSGVNFDTAVRFLDPDFLLECKISAIWRRFQLNLAFYMLNVRHISTSGLSDQLTHASTPTSIIPKKFESPTPIRSWVMSDNVAHWLPLKIRTRPQRMRRITWPVSRGSKTITSHTRTVVRECCKGDDESQYCKKT